MFTRGYPEFRPYKGGEHVWTEGWDDHVIFCFENSMVNLAQVSVQVNEGQIQVLWGFVLVPDLHSKDILASK